MTSKNDPKDTRNVNDKSGALNRNFMPINSADGAIVSKNVSIISKKGAIINKNAQRSVGAGLNSNSADAGITAGPNQGPAGAGFKRNGTTLPDAGGSKRNSGALANIFGLKRNSKDSTENPQSQQNGSDNNANSPEAAALRNSWNRVLFDFKRNSVPEPEAPPSGTAVIPGTPPSSLPGNNGAELQQKSWPLQQYPGPGSRKVSNGAPDPKIGQSAPQSSGQQIRGAGPQRVREEMPNSNIGTSLKRGSEDREPTSQAVGTNLNGRLPIENGQGTVANKVTFIVPYQPQSYGVVQPVNIVPVGDCPYCHAGYIYTRFSVLGILLAFIFFPLGIICCLLMQEQRCSYCGAEVGYVY